MSLVDNITIKIAFPDNTELSVSASDYLVEYDMLLELDSSGEKIAAKVSANELSFSLDNSEGVFSPTNRDSPYFGKIEEGLKVTISDNETLIGSFYISEWKAPTSSIGGLAHVVAVDRLQSVLNLPVSFLSIDKEVSATDYLTNLLKSVGFVSDDIIIDLANDEQIDYTVVNGDNLANVLNELCLYLDCYMYMNNRDKVVVRSKAISGSSVYAFDEDTNILSVVASESLLNSSNVLNLKYSAISLSTSSILLTVEELKVKKGFTRITNLKLDGGNVYDIDRVLVSSEFGISCLGFEATQNSISLDMYNPTQVTKKVKLVVLGRKITVKETAIERFDSLSITKKGRQEKTLNSKLIQDEDKANAVLDLLWSRVAVKTPYLVSEVELDDFSLALGDIVSVKADSLNLLYGGYLQSIKYSWLGGDVVTAQIGVVGSSIPS